MEIKTVKTANKVLRVILAVLLLLCLLEMPYGYYQFVRFAAMLTFAYFAYDSYSTQRNTDVILYVGLALLFQPFFKISLGRGIWNVVDVLVALSLLISIFIPKSIKSKR